MTQKNFAPKGEDVIRQEVLEDLGDGVAEDAVNRVVERRLKDESFKASLHEQKTKQSKGREHYKQMLEKQGIDPKLGKAKEPEKKAPISQESETLIRLENLELQRLNPDLTDTEIKEVRNYAKGAGIPVLDAYNSSIVQAGINQSIEQRKAEGAMPKGKSRTPSKLDFSEIDLSNSEHTKFLRENGKMEDYDKWIRKNG